VKKSCSRATPKAKTPPARRMAEGGQAKKPSFIDRAKSGLKTVSDALNPEKQLGPGARKQMERGREAYGGSRDRGIQRQVDKATGKR
jgi:hypothetical protein